MPTYEYRCAVCSTPFEVRRAMADDDAGIRCPEGHDSVRRVFSVFAAGRGDAPGPVGGGGGGCCGGACGCG